MTSSSSQPAGPTEPLNVDVVVLGATGFTGQLIAQYLAAHPTRPTIALAGRSPTKLASVNQTLPQPVPTIVADVEDLTSIEKLVQATKVVINVVGPFGLRRADIVVRECIRQQRHYCDLTGESRFYADVVREFADDAEKQGSVIVPSAGFDSVPFDLTTFLSVQEAKRLSKPKAVGVKDVYCSLRLSGGMSKGTLLSGVEMTRAGLPLTQVPRAKEETLPDSRWEMKPLYGDVLSPVTPTAGEHPIPRTLVTPAPGFGTDKVMSLFAFSPHNHRIVNRTWGLLQSHKQTLVNAYAYGDHFQYHDGPVFPFRLVAAIFTLITLVAPYFLAFFPPLVWAINALPDNWASSGTGESGFLDLRTVAESETGEKAITFFSCRGDPGYLKTAALISEVALTLLEPAQSRLVPAGVLTTPLLGPTFPQRLVKYGGFNITTERYHPTTASKFKAL